MIRSPPDVADRRIAVWIVRGSYPPRMHDLNSTLSVPVISRRQRKVRWLRAVVRSGPLLVRAHARSQSLKAECALARDGARVRECKILVREVSGRRRAARKEAIAETTSCLSLSRDTADR